MRNSATAILLSGLLLLGGCAAAPPTDTPVSGGDVRVELQNDHDRAYVITISVVPEGHTGLAVEFANGTVRAYPNASEIQDLPDGIVPRAISVRPVGDAVQMRIFRWGSPQGTSLAFDDVSARAIVHYSIAFPSGPEPMRALGRATCGPQSELTLLTLRINGDGSVAASNECTGNPDD